MGPFVQDTAPSIRSSRTILDWIHSNVEDGCCYGESIKDKARSESAAHVFTSSANGWTKPRRSSSANLPIHLPRNEAWHCLHVQARRFKTSPNQHPNHNLHDPSRRSSQILLGCTVRYFATAMAHEQGIFSARRQREVSCDYWIRRRQH